MQWETSRVGGFTRHTSGSYTLAEGTTHVRRNAGWGQRRGWKKIRIWNVLHQGNPVALNITSVRDAKQLALDHSRS